MPDDKTLLVAASLAQWDTALAHLRALDAVGLGVPDRARIEMERWGLAVRLAEYNDVSVIDIDVAVEEARRMCTENQGRLDELLREKE